MASDMKNNLWFATNRGLYKYSQATWLKFDESNSSLTSNRVTDLAIDKNDNLWGGLATYFYFDENLGIYLKKEGCLFKYDGESWTVYNVSNSGLPTNYIGTLDFDSKNVLWLNTRDERIVGKEYGGGLTRFDGSTWITYNIYNSDLPSNTIWDIYVDIDDNVWLGTCGQGLAKLDKNNNWKAYNVFNSGLAFNDVTKIMFDSNNKIWLAHLHDGGISVADLGVIDNIINSNCDNKVEGFKIFPNPTNNYIKIVILDNSLGDNTNIKIIDLMGRQLYSNTVKKNTNQAILEYTLSELNIKSNGVYLLSLLCGENEFIKKIIVLK